MKVLLVGSGGREHALAWALARSPDLRALDCTRGNPGIAGLARCLDLPDNVAALARHAADERYDLVVVGPEAPLVAGLADRLAAHGVPVFGPSAAAARVEGSKAFAKRFCERHRIPTASFRVFDDADEAERHLRSEADYPLVVKADGLAAGKGVVLADAPDEALRAANEMLRDGRFGGAGRTIVVERRLTGRETSFFVLADGERWVELAACCDYKRLGDGDLGPNTGGMGAYSPASHLDPATRQTIRERIVAPTIAGLAAEGAPYRGVLYIGLMLTADGPMVLEYNARFGDPETQVLLPRLDGDWLPLLAGAAAGRLPAGEIRWRDEAAVCVVMASLGYPGSYATGRPIAGLDRASALPGVHVFHAGTARGAGGAVVTAGGRVLGVTALGPDVARARARAYDAVASIRWDGEHHRGDIAADAAGVPQAVERNA
jgi:phosphoribosylamine--glycine ligase